MNAGNVARVLVLGVFLFACREIYAADEAKEAAVRFYQSYSALRQSAGLTGIPDEAQLGRLAPMIMAELRELFGAAMREQQVRKSGARGGDPVCVRRG
jgi:hypothetical protein